MSRGIDPERYAERLATVRALVAEKGLRALLIGVGPELEWLTGYAAHGHERLDLLVIGGGQGRGAIAFVGPRLEAAAARQAPGLRGSDVELQTWEEHEDPFGLVRACLGDGGDGRMVEVSDGLRAAFVLGLQAALPDSTFGVASATLAPLRRVKDADEVAILRRAAQAADRVIDRIVRGPLVGRSEAEVAREVRDRLVEEGHDSAEFAIVASGPHTASPHHEPGQRRIEAGEPLLLDIGGRLAGYFSDITRTVWVAGAQDLRPDDGFRGVYALVERAQSAGRDAVRPGASYASIDAAARSLIEASGHGDAFIHRLGHGVGLEVHEEPWVMADNPQVAEPGNAFSVEPGIYLEGRHGVRIEDIVVCAEAGVDTLNTAPRELLVVSGV